MFIPIMASDCPAALPEKLYQYKINAIRVFDIPKNLVITYSNGNASYAYGLCVDVSYRNITGNKDYKKETITWHDATNQIFDYMNKSAGTLEFHDYEVSYECIDDTDR